MDDGAKIGCRFFKVDSSYPTILFFHGNGETVADYDTIGPQFNEVGINFLVCDYRGYGWSESSPTVSLMLADAAAIFDQVKKTQTAENGDGPLFIMGRSLGSACAIDLAAANDSEIKGLILDSGFGDTLPLAATLGIIPDRYGLSEEDCFNNLEKISRVTKPTYILHGARDQLIAPTEGEKLQAASGARSKEFQIVPGADHNSIFLVAGKLYFSSIKQFIDKSTGQNNWRQRRSRATRNS